MRTCMNNKQSTSDLSNKVTHACDWTLAYYNYAFILPIVLCCSALEFDLLCSKLCSL